MAMRIAPVPYFWAEVKFPMLADCDAKGVEQFVDVAFRVKYKRLADEEYQTLLKRQYAQQLAALQQFVPAGMETGDAPKAAQVEPITDREVIDMVVLDWDQMVGEDDKPLPFNKDNLDRALMVLGCRSAIVKRYFELHKKEAEKNFAQPSVTSTGG